MSQAEENAFDFSSALTQGAQTASELDSQSRERLWGRVASRALEDPAFLDKLSHDPKGAIEKVAGGPVASGTVEQAKKLFSATLPALGDDQVGTLILETVTDIRKSFKSTLRLASVLFYAGLGMTVVAFGVAVLDHDKQLVAGLFGGGGLLTLISYVVMNPLDRIRNAAANLVQVQLAYVSYYKQLVLLGGTGDKLSREDAVVYARELRDSAAQMIASIQGTLEKSPPPALPAEPARKAEPVRQAEPPALPAATTGPFRAPPPPT